MQKIEAVPEGNIETYKRLLFMQRYAYGCIQSNQKKVFKDEFKFLLENIDALINEIE